jgi:fibronectin type 3 domain-containing protein
VVIALDAAGNQSIPSNPATATTQALSPPAAPTNVKAATGNPKASVSLTWMQSASPGVTQNKIYRGPSGGPYAPVAQINPATSYVDTKLTSGTSYCYVVTALSAGGESAKSAPESCAKAK